MGAQRKHLADGELTCEADAALDGPGRDRFTAALDTLNGQHDWWAEPLRVVEADGAALRLTANLTLIGFEAPDGELVDVDPDDDAFMAWMDLCVAVDFLRDQSGALGLGWRVVFGGEPVGELAGGEESEALEAFLVALGEAVGADFDERDDERAVALDELYAGRR